VRCPLRLSGTGTATDHAERLLRALGVPVERAPGEPDPDPLSDWAASGAMELTGRPGRSPLPAPAALASCMRGAGRALSLLAGGALDDLDAPALLGERAALLGLSRRGAIAPGGSCRLVRARDGWLALNLAREEDVELLPAWLAAARAREPWDFVRERASCARVGDLVERGRLLGLAVATAAEPAGEPPSWFRVAARGTRRAPGTPRVPRVLDLSALWAGPLCAHLLELAGADVIKVESARRPDGARSGAPAFYDLQNAGKRSVALDFATGEGRAALLRLLESADIVIESARPRALRQLGIDADTLVRRVPGLTWVSITGHGRREPGANWVAFGDDAGVAAGLAVATAGPGNEPLFCGDAIADPLTGLHAALAARATWRAGGGALLELALVDVVAHVLGTTPRADRPSPHTVVSKPRARPVTRRAAPLGAHTREVLAELASGC
jgi:crotonobetainyl-CoA:carnitine CoA-transferase CaiB-like acyl-CoA transferase